MRIRPFTPRDLPAVRDIEIRSYPKLVDACEYADRWNCCSVAILDEKVVGFYLFSMSQVGKGKTIFLERLAVDPQWRQATIGSQLVEQMLKDARGFRRIVALIPESNLPAQCFLRANGFRCSNILRDKELYHFTKKLT